MNLDDILRNNPDLRVLSEFGGETITDAAKERARAELAVSPLAAQFERVWRAMDGPELTKEYRFHEGRRWKADYAYLPARVIVELEGGIYTRGRHTRGKGYAADCAKYNLAASMGFTVFRLATGMCVPDNIQSIIDYIRSVEL
jgi:very-short-patch-repair endonuclease